MSRAKIATTLAVAVAASAGAQTPDFSGKWTVVAPARAAGATQGAAPPSLSEPGNMGSGWGSPMTLTQDAGALTVEYSTFHPRDVQPAFRFIYLLNGGESRNTVNNGRGPQLQVSRVTWQERRLVITTTHQFVNPRDGQAMTSETRQTLSLEAPDTLLIETFRPGVLGGKSSTARTNYMK